MWFKAFYTAWIAFKDKHLAEKLAEALEQMKDGSREDRFRR